MKTKEFHYRLKKLYQDHGRPCRKSTKRFDSEGVVKRLVSYGAFIEIFPGVEGLVHISQISHKHIGTPKEVLREGEQIKVKVLEVNENDQRLSLSVKELKEKYAEVIDYELPEETKGFQLGEMIGDQLKKLKEEIRYSVQRRFL